MRKILTILVAATALTAVGVPAWSAMQAPLESGVWSSSTLSADDTQTLPLVFVSDDDDEDDDHDREGARRGNDDDNDDEDCDDDDDDCRGGTSNPAPAGTVAPPQNGLFGNGAPPKVQVN